MLMTLTESVWETARPVHNTRQQQVLALQSQTTDMCFVESGESKQLAVKPGK